MTRIPEDIVRKIVESLDIVEVISSYYPLKKAGRNYKMNCPFHNEKTPSFVVNPDKQIFHCFGCGVGGDVISFIVLQERLDFIEAVRFLARKANILLPEASAEQDPFSGERQMIFQVNEAAVTYFHNLLLSDKSRPAAQARQYLQSRGISLKTVEAFRLGFALDQWDALINALKKDGIHQDAMQKAGLAISRERGDGYYDRFRGRIIFPIFDTRGHCRAFGARVFGQKEEPGAKYINSPETLVYTKGHHLYGFHLAKQTITKEDQVIIVEGYMDCLIPYQAGVENIVASLGTALTVEQIRLIRRYTKNVVLLFDADLAGQSAMLRSLDVLIEEGMDVTVAQLEDGEDPDSFVVKYGTDQFRDRIAHAKDVFDFKLNHLIKKFDRDSATGKARIAGEMLPTIYRFSNALEKAEYRRRLAKILDIDEQILMAEYKKIGESFFKQVSRKIEARELVVKSQVRAVERDILRLLLDEDRFVRRTQDHLKPEDFQDYRIREIISKLFEMCDQGQPVTTIKIMNSFDDLEIRKMITEIMAEEIVASDKDKMHADYVERIKKDRLRIVRQELIEEIQQAEQTKDAEKLAELKIKFNELIKQ